MRRPVIALVVILVGLGLFASGLAWMLDAPKPPPGTSRVGRLYLGLCADCHGADGHGSWRATFFLIRPGDLAAPARMSKHTDQYLFDIIKHGGAPFGRPGMPAFGASLNDDDLRALVEYLRALSRQGSTRRAEHFEERHGFAGVLRALGPGEREGGVAPFAWESGGHVGAPHVG